MRSAGARGSGSAGRRRHRMLAEQLVREEGAVAALGEASVAAPGDERGEAFVIRPFLALIERRLQELDRGARADFRVVERLLRIGEMALVDLEQTVPLP